MKTSNTILLGFVLLYLIVQSISFAIGHSNATGTKEKRAFSESLIRSQPFEEDFSVLMIEANGFYTLHQAAEPVANFNGNQEFSTTSLECTVTNDTCFVRAIAPDSVGSRNLALNLPDIRRIHISPDAVFQLNGKFDSLYVQNDKARFIINSSSHIGFLELDAHHSTQNDLRQVQKGIFNVDNDVIQLIDKANDLEVNLKNSNIRIHDSPDKLLVEKDASSKVQIY